jgi:1D-myo-inositol-tetrakisphosphate 5-kinase/inositol-polyphosphate multikinase
MTQMDADSACRIFHSDGTLSDPGGELFVKPCVQQEIEFYEKTFAEHPEFAALMPMFLGTLALNDATTVESIDEQLPAVSEHLSHDLKEEAVRRAKQALAEGHTNAEAEEDQPANITWQPNKNRRLKTDRSVVLENTTYGFKKPNVLDAKLGRRLWADDAPLEKKKRFDEISRTTTNGTHGFRIAGMRIYKGSDNPDELDADGFKVFDKDYGRFEVNPDNIVQAMAGFIFNERAGIDKELGRAVSKAFLRDLRRVEEVLSNSETRMYSASLLFTFEGDGEALRKAIEEHNAIIAKAENGSSEEEEQEVVEVTPIPKLNGATQPNGVEAKVLNGAVASIDGPIEGDLKVVQLMGAPPSDSEEEEEEEDDLSTMPRVYSLKLIDFAHASWTPGQGPDENSLLGVRSLIKIFEELAEY